MMGVRSIIGAVILLALAGCGAGDAEPAGRAWTAERDTVGDTVIVRTVAGAVWDGPRTLVEELRIGVFDGAEEYMFGDVDALAAADDGSIYVLDGHVPALRKYSPAGEFVATFGREGGGPGEYARTDGGLAVLPDGRVLLRDPGNARINVYGPDGEVLGGWPIRGGLTTFRKLYTDTAGNVYTLVLLDARASVSDWRMGLARYSPDGRPGETLAAPTWDFDEAQISGQSENSTNTRSVPFGPSDDWSFSPLGYFVGGVNTRYGIELFRPDAPVLRIERAIDPVPVGPRERADAEARVTASMRRQFPGWQWNGPPIPDHKPPFSEVLVSERGRIWVRLHRPGERIPGAADEPVQPGEVPERRWREPVVFDVFAPDGRYLGAVDAPDGLSLSPAPVIDGDRVWAVVRDELDVNYVVRFRIEPAATAP